MNKISVSHDQHQKLVKMCKAFFPETKNWMDNYVVIHRQTCNICVKEQVLKGVYFNEYEEEDPQLHYITLSNEAKIPWFEFCIKYLSEKIYKKLELLKIYDHQFGITGETESDDMWINNKYGIVLYMLLSEKHPIDYLYEQFKMYEKNQ